MDILEIKKIVSEKWPDAESEHLDKAFRIFKDQVDEIPFADTKGYTAAAVDRAHEAAREGALIEFVSFSLFCDLLHENRLNADFLLSELGSTVALLAKSYLFVHRAFGHEPERQSLQHSYRVAQTISTIKISPATIVAAMMHEISGHYPEQLPEVRRVFGPEVADLVDAYSALHGIKTPENPQYVKFLREMLLAMAKDARPIIIKICSNMDLVKTGTFCKTADDTRRLAKESLELLSPIADLLGVWSLRWPMEDHAFKILHPEEYEQIHERFNSEERADRDKFIHKMKSIVKKAAKDTGIPCQIQGRFKNYYSIYQKMQRKNRFFHEIGDVFALRIIVETEEDCYRLLGIIHKIWRPKHRRIKDYIAAPKNNNYRSLHTTVYGLNGRPTEFQIRTHEMDEEAEFGVAAHYYYKNSKTRVPHWIKDLISKQATMADEDFYKDFSKQVLLDHIYVYSPKGDIISLPQGSTPVDFAYQVHTEIGNHCVGALVNDLPFQLDQELSTNDVVHIITDPNQTAPKREWLLFVKTEVAKKSIESFFAKKIS
jgi:guanosine-3',5'-bis(diphosphate) 3'-pyrophosphohydrolase